MIDYVDLYIISNDKTIDLSMLHDGIKPNIVNELSYDYNDLFHDGRLPECVYYRWEIFNNSIFSEYDKILYLDVDTEI